ncbi:MAG TPA: hypothetical protein QKA14_02535 [Candidatus Megaira endosymbiont of Hartmannula sinica]|nr:hypothetical protein [Candidatus Megaera endosymbiont of Hartmannula sinica]
MVYKLLAKNNTTNSKLPKIHFIYNTDSTYINNILKKIDPKNTSVLVISNSGSTLETIAITGALISYFKKQLNSNVNNNYDRNISETGNDFTLESKNEVDLSVGSMFYFITNQSTNNKLAKLANEMGSITIPHGDKISGRYSSFTNVCFIIMMLANLNIEEYIKGGRETLNDYHNNKIKSQAFTSATNIFLSGKNILVNLSYTQSMQHILDWYSQIIAESLGKKGKGYTPLRSLGPNDQHSMFQLYLEGPRDKFFSFISTESNIDKTNKSLDHLTIKEDNLGINICNRTIDEINIINKKASLHALNSQKMPIRDINIPVINEYYTGMLVAHMALEVISIGHLIEVNPFNQNGVEIIKSKARELINNQ